MKKLYKKYAGLFGKGLGQWAIIILLAILILFILLNAMLLIPSFKAWTISISKGSYNVSNLIAFFQMKIEAKNIVIFAAFISAMLGIAIPISLSVISNLDKKYNQSGISKEFLSEPINYSQYYLLFLNILFLITFMFSSSLSALLSSLYIAFFLVTVINFIAYILLIQNYLTDAKQYIYEKCDEKLTKYLNEKSH